MRFVAFNIISLIFLSQFAFNSVFGQYNGGIGQGYALCLFEAVYEPMYYGGSGKGDDMCASINTPLSFFSGSDGKGDAVCNSIHPNRPFFSGGDGKGDDICANVNPPLDLFAGGANRGDAVCFELDIDPLPVELDYFEAYCNDNVVNLYWATFTESNNHYFYIEKSTDGENWQILDTVIGAGSTTDYSEYKLSDTRASNQVTYYRLTQVDFDGKYETFHPVSTHCNFDYTNDLLLYPNPTSSSFRIRGLNEPVRIEMYNQLGKLVKTVYEVSDEQEIPTENLIKGVYYVKIISTNWSSTKKLVKS